MINISNGPLGIFLVSPFGIHDKKIHYSYILPYLTGDLKKYTRLSVIEKN